jgi:hypothetical protein
MSKLLTDISSISKLSGFDANIDNDTISPFIFMAQNNEIKRILGDELYLKIITDYSSVAGLDGNYLLLYNDYIEIILAYFTCSFYLQLGIVKVSQNGAYLVTPEKTQQTPDDLKKMADRYLKLAVGLEIRMVNYLDLLNLPERPEPSSLKSKSNFNWRKP